MMSYSTGAILCGGGVLAYGLYSAITAKGSAAAVSKQRQVAIQSMAIGVCIIAAGTALYLSQLPRALTTCDVQILNQILKNGGENTLTQKAFKVFDETQKISCDNFLPWQNRYLDNITNYIDYVQPKDLQKSAMWGVANFGRPFIALKYSCVNLAGQTSVGVATLFPANMHPTRLMGTGGRFQALNCHPDFIDVFMDNRNHTEFATNLWDFLTRNPIHTYKTTLLLAI